MRKLYTSSVFSSIIVLLTVMVVSATPAAAIESFGVGAVPANPRADNTRTKSIFVYELGPAQTTNDGIVIVNNSDTTKTLSVYAIDSQASSDGAFACAQQADAPKDVGNWIKLSKDHITLEPKTNETIHFDVTVPLHADVGEHNGCIAIQDMSSGSQQSHNGIALSFRSALRVAITVPGKLISKLQFVDVKTKPLSEDKMQITPAVKNTGNVSLDTDFQVKLANVFGTTIVSSGGEFPVLRQTMGRFNFELETPFWGGWYEQVTEAHYAPLTQSGKVTSKESAIQSKWLFIAPRPAAVLIETTAGILAVAAIATVLWRQYHHKRLHTRAIAYKVKDGDNLQLIAKSHHIKWQKLAKLNKLKPPYTLSTGTTIRVPRMPKKPDATNPDTHLKD